ncbi:histidine kinase [Flavobacterium sp.]|jgi:signal transduction histidine kinase/tetratricopeptide (TPR) repeat protein|uniref:tetratricopeptide repeat-containing sensor histidine kinase n=1 Tax=Flavobacterium sp. TaxID=239 RepID=UPI0037BF22A2
MSKKLIYWGIILLVSLYGCTTKTTENKEAQAINDSIKKYLDLADNDTITYDKRVKYNDKAYSLIDLNRNDTLTRYNLSYVSYNYGILVKNDLLKSTAEKLMTLSLKSNDSLNIARANRNFGLYYVAISDNEKAISYLFKAKKIFKLLNRYDYVIKVMSSIAITQYYASDFLGSNKTSVEMIKLATKANFYSLNSFALINIADNLSALHNNEDAIKYYKRVLKEHKVKNSINRNSLHKNYIYNRIADSYVSLKQYDSASKYVYLNLNNKKLSFVNPTVYSIAISLSALIKLKTGDYNKLEKQFNLAEYYFHRFKSVNGRNYNQIYLSQYYEKVNNKKKAIDAANKALKFSEEYNNTTDILASLDQLIKVDKKNASTNAQEYIRINDSMQMAERNFRDKFARIAFETDEISKEKETAIKQKWIIVTIAGVIIVLLLIITRQRSKQKELQFQQSQQKANGEIYHLMLAQKAKEDEARQTEKKRIARELHDGIMNKLSSTRLNLAILSKKTDTETIQKCLTYINQITQIETDIRNISHDLNQDVFQEEDSFRKMIEDFVNQQNTTSKTHYELELDNDIDWNAISSEIKMNLYRIIQEATHNINKYGQAKKASISLVLDAPNICMAITDNGIGFDTSVSSKGIGIQNMQARVKLLNGKFNIRSTKLDTTCVNIAIPIK